MRPDAARAGIEALGVYRARLRALAQGDAAPPAAAPPAAAPSAPLPTAAGGGLSFDTLAVHVTSTGLLIEKRLAAP
ncbi:MAG: hypothetical protein FJ138_16115 [Deltaproteobacteria bacterium]|nr:hypothetical protein [Deltaproteobacteria bacterium]